MKLTTIVRSHSHLNRQDIYGHFAHKSRSCHKTRPIIGSLGQTGIKKRGLSLRLWAVRALLEVLVRALSVFGYGLVDMFYSRE